MVKYVLFPPVCMFDILAFSWLLEHRFFLIRYQRVCLSISRTLRDYALRDNAENIVILRAFHKPVSASKRKCVA